MKAEAAILITFTVFIFCESAYVDTLKKCALADGNCLKALYQSIMKDIAGTGISELGIPPTDPLKITDVETSALGFLNITFIDGEVKGVKDCALNSIETNVEKKLLTTDLLCDVFSIKGHYKLEPGPFVGNLFGDDVITGDGNGQVDFDKLALKFKIPFDYQKHDDGEIYMKCNFNEAEYTYDILGKIMIDADNILLGSQEVSKIVVKFLNEKWKYVLTSFGKIFADKAVEIFYVYLEKFFEGVPVKNYITDDLTPYFKT